MLYYKLRKREAERVMNFQIKEAEEIARFSQKELAERIPWI